MAPLISLCMIVKDEEDELPLALASAAPFVDEMVVYDTGSSDDTMAIARAHGATVIEGYWDDDFSRARNAALDACHGRWILWLDADESLTGNLQAQRRGLPMVPAEVDGLVVSIEALEGNGLLGRNSFLAIRLFRRELCRFEGRIHEQVVRVDGVSSPSVAQAAELRILHRGYTAGFFSDGSKYERNLRLARQALADPDVDRAVALFDYGRTLMMGPDAAEALAPLAEAADLAVRPTSLRYTLQILATLQTGLGRHDDALATVRRLREASAKQLNADILEARVHLAAGRWMQALEVSERVPFVDVDDDGVEGGRHHVSSLRARALAELGRPGEAADELLESLRNHGILDEPLPVLVGYLLAAGRPLAELAAAVRPEVVPVFAAAASVLPPAQADVVLTALHERFPERLEPLALGGTLGARLPVARALWWSAALRRRGHLAPCPLVAITGNEEIEPVVRLRAAAAAFGSFADQRVVEPARRLCESLAGEEAGAALAEVRALSPTLAELLAPAVSSVAVLLSLDGEVRDGFTCCTTRSDPPEGARTVSPLALPFPAGGVHLLQVRDVLAATPPARSGQLLDEWRRVLADGGELVVEVPDLAAVLRRQLDSLEQADERPWDADGSAGPEQESMRALYGRRRFGPDGEGEALRRGWTRQQLVRELVGHGFRPESIDEGAVLRARCRLAPVEVRAASPVPGEPVRPEVSLVVVSGRGAEALRSCLRAVASTQAGASYEVVCVDNGADPASTAFLATLAGAATVLRCAVPMHYQAAVNLAVARCRGEVIVLLDSDVEVGDGWAGSLRDALDDRAVAAATATVLDAEGHRCGGGYRLRGEAATPRLVRQLDADPCPGAIGPGCVALRARTWSEIGGLACGLGAEEAVIDASLAAARLGSLLQLDRPVRRAGSAAGGQPATGAVAGGKPEDADAGASACSSELAHRWAGQLVLEPPAPKRLTASSLLPTGSLLDRIQRSADLPIGAPRTGGCNLVGDFDGVAPEAGRAQAWQLAQGAAGLPCSRLGYRNGHLDVAVADADSLAFDTTLLCLGGEDLVEYVSRAGLDSLRGRYTILDWHWPFAEPSPATAGEASMVSEIWVPSRYTQRGLREATDRPVRLQPMPVVPAQATLAREDLGIPNGFVFASLAEIGRGRPGDVALANPTAVVEAFCAAFPRPGGPRLYLALCGTRTESVAQACREAARGRDDVIVAEELPIGGADSVLAHADAYVSLHRSSAFGVALARALAGGLPVVATRAGGPLDYLDDGVAELVDCSPSTTTADHLPYAAGMHWFEPDLDDAAAALALVHDDPARARARAHLGAVRIGRSHGVEATGRMLRQRVEAVAPLRPAATRPHRGRRRARR